MNRPAILVIRSDGKFSSILRGAGFEVVNLELIETKPLEDLSGLREKLAHLSEYDGVFITSAAAARIFVNERKGSNGFYGSVYALGERSQTILATAGLNVRTAVEANTAEEMLNAFDKNEFKGKRFLFVRGERSLRTIPELLGSHAQVDEVAVYRTDDRGFDKGKIEEVVSRISNDEIRLICFFSPSGVERFKELYGDVSTTVKTAAIGTTTADAARQAGFDVEYISPKSKADDFALGLIEHIKSL